MIDAEHSAKMIASIESFSFAWGFDFRKLGTTQQLMMIRNYYLDMICADVAKRNAPKVWIDPSKLGRG